MKSTGSFLALLAAGAITLLASPAVAAENAATPPQSAPGTQQDGGPAKDREKPQYPLPDDPRPYASSPHAAKIDLALNFLISDHSFGRWGNFIYLDLLQRKFGLHKRYSLKETFPPERRDNVDRVLLQTFNRLTEPGQRFDANAVPAMLKNNPVFWILITALYCDQLPMPADAVSEFSTLLEANQQNQAGNAEAENNIESLALAYQWIKENGCMAAEPGFVALKDNFRDALAGIAMTGPLRRHAAYEAVALLYYLGCGGVVEKHWVDEIAAAQQPDGGWAYTYDPGIGVSDGQPTVFALWVLLESALPDAPATPMIRKTGDMVGAGK